MYNPFRRKPIVKPSEGSSVIHRVEVAGGRGLDPLATVLSRFRRRPTTHVLREQLPKRGMWVMYMGETYILTDLERGDVATIHKVLADGTSEYEMRATGPQTVEYHVPAFELTQAYLEDIPESRRPDPEIAARFGYHSKATL